MKKTIHIASIADENYKRYLMACITSVMASAGDTYHIVFHMVKDELNSETIETYETFITGKGHEVKWMTDMSHHVDIPLTMYFTRAASLRLFLAEMVDPSVDTILYLDSDIIVCDDGIEKLAEIDIGDCAIGAVGDVLNDFQYMTYRTGIDDPNYLYFNSGVLMINLKKWREVGATQKHIQILREKYKTLVFVDQDVLNICWKDDVYYLPLNFNVTSTIYACPPKFLAKRNGKAGFTKEELLDAVKHPYLIHFYGSMENRPWKTPCLHPEKQRYVDAANASPYPFVLEQSTKAERREYWKFHHFGYRVLLFRRIKNKTKSKLKGWVKKILRKS